MILRRNTALEEPGRSGRVTTAHSAVTLHTLLRTMASGIGNRYEIDLAEAFHAVRCGPGHFDIVAEITTQMLERMSSEAEIV